MSAGATGSGAFLIRRRTEDPVLETVVSLVTPYAAYVLAESVEGSGVTAVVVASVVLGTQATRLTTASIRLQLGAVFGTVVFLLESVVFGLIGLQLPELVGRIAHAGWVLPARGRARRGGTQDSHGERGRHESRGMPLTG